MNASRKGSRRDASRSAGPDREPVASGWHSRAEESSLYRRPLSDGQWRQILSGLAAQYNRLGSPAMSAATAAIAAGIDWLDRPMQAYCQSTCADCPDPCCSARKVFFRLSDLLYLVVLDEALPLGQTRQQAGESCRYLGPAGCLLPRRYRPYVCTWFLCAPQMERFNQEPPAFQRRFIQALTTIRAARLDLEAAYRERFGDPWCPP